MLILLHFTWEESFPILQQGCTDVIYSPSVQRGWHFEESVQTLLGALYLRKGKTMTWQGLGSPAPGGSSWVVHQGSAVLQPSAHTPGSSNRCQQTGRVLVLMQIEDKSGFPEEP
jgi:hypothetical protein